MNTNNNFDQNRTNKEWLINFSKEDIWNIFSVDFDVDLNNIIPWVNTDVLGIVSTKNT